MQTLQKALILLLLPIIFASDIMAKESTKNAYDFSFESLNGGKINLSDYKGKVIMVVNTACNCGFSLQYHHLQTLYDNYKDKGLVVISVPSSDFGDQEFSDPEDIETFTSTEYDITFPIASITNIKGKEAHPFYTWAHEELGFLAFPKWNFHKYLINKKGELVHWFSTLTNPESEKVINKIEELLNEE